MIEIEYGNQVWDEDTNAANAEAQRRACLVRDASDPANRREIYFSDLGKLTILPAELAEIAGLQTLIVGDATINGQRFEPPQKLENLDVLGHLPHLRKLNLVDCGMLSFPEGAVFPDLQEVNISNSLVDDLDWLKASTQLTVLNLSYKRVSDVSALGGMSGLQSLNLSATQVSDASALGGMSGLQSLNLSSTPVSDVSALGGLAEFFCFAGGSLAQL